MDEQPQQKKLLAFIPSYFYLLNAPIVIAAIVIGWLTGLGLIFVLIMGVLGYLAGWLYSKSRLGVTDGVENFVSWANVVTWIIPFIGIIVSCASLATISRVASKDRRRIIILTYVGLYLSLANSILGEIVIMLASKK
jgi:hypothetical protein